MNDKYSIFNKDFFPTPESVLDHILFDIDLTDKVVLEPSAGIGDIVRYCSKHNTKQVLTCERVPEFITILKPISTFISDDFLKVKSEDVSHINYIIMNPPFSADERHILHAWQIAPEGCKIISLCNTETIKNDRYSSTRQELKEIINNYGYSEDLGDCFSTAERKTNINISCVKLTKPSSDYNTEFEGFFMEDEPETAQGNGLVKYDFVKDIVQRYIQAVKIYDKQIESAVELNSVLSGFYSSTIAFSCKNGDKEIKRSEFKKDLQKSAWKFLFDKFNLKKYSTKSLKEDINKFIEEQQNFPFTMKNIYRMVEVIIGTTGQRMDKALLEVFDKITQHYDENKYHVEGWKTNSYYLLNKKFITPYCISPGWSGEISRSTYSSSTFELIEDFVKALCYISGDNYSNLVSLDDFISNKYFLVDDKGNFLNEKNYDFDVTIRNNKLDYITNKIKDYPNSKLFERNIEWGKCFDWTYFRVKAYKKGTLHIEFKDLDLWAKFNQRIAKIKGYPLYEHSTKK
jgi:predicted RNA methylase